MNREAIRHRMNVQRLILTALLALTLASAAPGQQTSARTGSNNLPPQESGDAARRAAQELQEAARAYKAGDFAGAQRHSERALELDPSQPNAPFFIARAIHAQYRQGIDMPENIGKARAAIAAYQRILDRWPDNDEAFLAISFLYGAIKEDGQQLDWVRRRALDSSVPLEKRAAAYVFLASKNWDCSFRVTENEANKYALVGAKGKTTVRFKMPENREDFDRATLCINRGLEEAEMAVILSPNDAKAWRYKAALFYEARKLAEMEGDMKRARKFWREGEGARKRAEELNLKIHGEQKQPNAEILPSAAAPRR